LCAAESMLLSTFLPFFLLWFVTDCLFIVCLLSFSVRRIPWRIFCSDHLVVLCCFGFSLSWKTFIGPSICMIVFLGRLSYDNQPLFNWWNHTWPYSEIPQAMVNPLESIFQTLQPTWDDCQLILLIIFNTE
jgi:hypothetical protein